MDALSIQHFSQAAHGMGGPHEQLERLIMDNENTFAVGDRVWLKNANGDPITTGNTYTSRREVAFTIKAVNGQRYELDTHNTEARRRYCAGIGYPASALVSSS